MRTVRASVHSQPYASDIIMLIQLSLRSEPFITMCLNRIFIVLCVYTHRDTLEYWIQKSIFNSNGHQFPEQWEMLPILKWHYIWKGFKINGHWKCVNGWSKWGTDTDTLNDDNNNITFSKRHKNSQFLSSFRSFVCLFASWVRTRRGLIALWTLANMHCQGGWWWAFLV